MRALQVTDPTSYEAWRAAARNALEQGLAPEDLIWDGDGASPTLFGEGLGTPPGFGEGGPAAARFAQRAPTVPAAFPELARAVLCHRDGERFDLLYRTLWRLQDNPRLLDIASDRDVVRLNAMAKAVRRDCHKMTAFVRFRAVELKDGQLESGAGEAEPAITDRRRFVAWFEPEHLIVERTAPFFARRFATMRWSIFTPDGSAHWDGRTVSLSPGMEKPVVGDDPAEALWRTYYANIFNPARLKVKAMQAEMPKKYWRNLPEAELIPGLIEQAQSQVKRMVEKATTTPSPRALKTTTRVRSEIEARRPASRDLDPASASPANLPNDLPSLARVAAGCTRCNLACHATQTVFGEGPAGAAMMLVGEQPGDREDIVGRPFVGPAGQLLDTCLSEAGIRRDACYLTNAVKHFKFAPRGKRRIHQKPDAGEVQVCRWWLDGERAIVRPRLIVALGATAALSLTGRGEGLLKRRGSLEEDADGTPVFITVHPSFLLRLPDRAQAEAERVRFVADLARAKALAFPAAA